MNIFFGSEKVFFDVMNGWSDLTSTDHSLCALIAVGLKINSSFVRYFLSPFYEGQFFLKTVQLFLGIQNISISNVP